MKNVFFLISLFSLVTFGQWEFDGFIRPVMENLTVVEVVNNNNSGEGSLRWALELDFPRHITFNFSGTIQLTGDMMARNPYFFVDGHSAPAPGVLVVGAPLRVFTHDWVVQHIHWRRGDGNTNASQDCISLSGSNCYNGVIDHCSVYWAIDENIGMNGARDIIVSNCIIAEGLNNAWHRDGAHSKGILVYFETKGLTIMRNLFVNNRDRNPLLEAGTECGLYNNVAYNGYQPPNMAKSHRPGSSVDLPFVVNAIGNTSEGFRNGYKFRFNNISPNSRAYFDDNNFDLFWGSAPNFASEPVLPIDVEVLSRVNGEQFVVNNAGAFPEARCASDQRSVDFWVNKVAGDVFDSSNEIGIIDSPNDVGWDLFEYHTVPDPVPDPDPDEPDPDEPDPDEPTPETITLIEIRDVLLEQVNILNELID